VCKPQAILEDAVSETLLMNEESEKSPQDKNILNIGPGVLAGTLSMGLPREDGGVLVLDTSFSVRGMSGREEDILAGKGNVIARLNLMMSRCVTSIGPRTSGFDKAIMALSATDRAILLLAIRRATVGDTYRMRVTCPTCHDQEIITTGRPAVDLSEVEFKRPADLTPERSFSDELPMSKQSVRWHVLCGEDEMWLGSIPAKKRQVYGASLAFLARVDAVGGSILNRAASFEACINILADLPSGDRQWLRNRFSAREGDVDLTITYTFEECGHFVEFPLDVSQRDFFSPQEI